MQDVTAARRVGVVATLTKGCDLDYIWRQVSAGLDLHLG
jgi:hypothetical protein